MNETLRSLLKAGPLNHNHRQTLRRLDQLTFATGVQSLGSRDTSSLGFAQSHLKVFSQFGEDGVIQYLIDQLESPTQSFVEVGVQTYEESNTRFLLMNNNWSGLIVDGDSAHVAFAQQTELDWRYDLRAEVEFVTAENINSTLERNAMTGDIGLLSIDVDGVDYWLWDATEVVSPQIVVMEYNSVFGPNHAVTVPYDPTFERLTAHWSNVYFGASLGALDHLARSKGYDLIGCEPSGANAFFLRQDVNPGLPAKTVADAFVRSKTCDTRDRTGNLSYVRNHSDRLRLIADMELLDVVSGAMVRGADLLKS